MISAKTLSWSSIVAGLLMTLTLAYTSPEVSTPAGTFKGTVMTSPQGHPFQAFLGIPFALPPVGQLRFAKPQPHPVLEEVYEATNMLPVCVQAIVPGNKDPGQEDCLYLNVFVPAGGTEDATKKVFVYIYGGGFFIGSARDHIPGDLVALGDVIVVTFNYRLSWLGNMWGEHPSLPGNQGFRDQLLALNWVKQNIGSFGGDPDDVTIGGESAGAFSVTLLSILPHSKGLFNKVFIMSGAVSEAKSTVETSKLQLGKLTDRVGCEQETVDATVECLKELPTKAFHLPSELWEMSTFPSIDNDLLSAPVQDLLKDEDYLESVGFYSRSYFGSLVNNEGIIVFRQTFDCGIDEDNPDAEVLGTKFEISTAVAEKIIDFYSQPNQSLQKPAIDIIGDVAIVVPECNFIDTFTSRRKDQRGSAYMLWFDYKPAYLPADLGGFPHALDVSYLFDLEVGDLLSMYYQAQPDGDFTDTDWQHKNRYINMVVDFMKHGDPGVRLQQQLNLNWPTYEKDSGYYLALEPEPKVKQFLLKERRDFWEHTLPQLMQESPNDKEEL